MARPRKYPTYKEAQEANRIKTRERKKERNRLRQHAKLAMLALQVDLAKQAEHATNTEESREQSVESTMTMTEPEPESSDEQAIAEQLVRSLFLRPHQKTHKSNWFIWMTGFVKPCRTTRGFSSKD